MEVDEAAHGVHVILKHQAELVFGVALSLQGVDHLFHSGAPSAHAAETLPKSLRHAPQSVLHERLTLGGGTERGGGASVRAQPSQVRDMWHFCSLSEPEHQPVCVHPGWTHSGLT